MTTGSTWWPRVTIRDLLSWPVIVLATPGGIIPYLVAYSTGFQTNPAASLTIALGAMAIFFLTVWAVLLLVTLMKLPSDSPLLAFTAATIAAISRGAGIWFAHGFIDTGDSLSPGLKIAASVLTLVPIAIITTGVVVAFSNYRAWQHETDILEAALANVDQHAEEHIDAFNESTLSKARRGIDEVASALRTAAINQSATDALKTIRRVSNEVVTPLSTSLRLPQDSLPKPEPVIGPPRTSWAKLWEATLSGKPHWPVVTGVLTGIAVIPHMVNTLPPGTALLLSGLWAGAIIGVIWLQNIILGVPELHTRTTIRLGTVVVLAATGVGVLLWLIELEASLIDLDPTTHRLLVNTALTLPASMTLILLARGTLARIRETLALRDRKKAELDTRMTQANEQFWQRRSALSNALHGPVQAALNATELRSKSAVEEQRFTPELAEELASGLQETVSDLVGRTSPTTDLAVTLERIRQTWEGLCEVEWTVTPELLSTLSDSSSSASLADIVVEAVFNAVRHASAQHVLIGIETAPGLPQDATLLVSVYNDGGPLPISTRVGQGSALFDLLSQRWSITPATKSSRMTTLLQLEIPLSAVESVA